MTCSTTECGTGLGSVILPSDPSNNSVLSATPAFGGIDVSWTLPTTNPHAVAYTNIYRGLLNDPNASLLIATAGGSLYFDKSPTNTQTTYYYWIRFVSVNGTVGDLIGPASAVAKPPIAQVIEQLTQQIDQSMLASTLRAKIDDIGLNYQTFLSEVDARIAANTALSNMLAQVQTGLDNALTYINTEITRRQDGDSALVDQINTLAAANGNGLALIQTEQQARIDGDTANASSISTLSSQVNNATTGLPATRALLLSDYYTKTAADSAIASATSTLVSTTGLATALGSYPTTATLQTGYYTKTATDTAISNAVTTSQTALNNSIATAQTTLQTNINTVSGKANALGALYTAKVDVNGLVGGFGVYNDGTSVDAGFNVDSFWIGRTAANKRKPFIVSGGTVYIDSAVIANASIDLAKINTASIGSLSALNADLGYITAGSLAFYQPGNSSNALRIQSWNQCIEVWNAGVLRVKLGNLA